MGGETVMVQKTGRDVRSKRSFTAAVGCN